MSIPPTGPVSVEGLNRHRQVVTYGVLSLLALAMTWILVPSPDADFERFYGGVHPVAVTGGAVALGASSLYILQRRAGFAVLRSSSSVRGLAISAAWATLLGAAIICADLILRYPEDVNIPAPEALLFYPAIGLVAEIAFHVFPLALLLLCLAPFQKRLGLTRSIWLSIAVVVAAEPAFQVALEDEPASPEALYTGIHVGVIALIQLALFRRFDFATMYGFRIVYYAYWHIAWGTIRLHLLF